MLDSVTLTFLCFVMQFLFHEQKVSLTSLWLQCQEFRKMTNQKKRNHCPLCVYNWCFQFEMSLTSGWHEGKSTSYDGEDRHWREVTAELPWSTKYVLQVFMKINAKFMQKRIILLTCSSMFTRDTNRLKGDLFILFTDMQRRPGKGDFKHIWSLKKKNVFTLKRYHSFVALFVHWFGHQELGESRVFLLFQVKYDLTVYLWYFSYTFFAHNFLVEFIVAALVGVFRPKPSSIFSVSRQNSGKTQFVSRTTAPVPQIKSACNGSTWSTFWCFLQKVNQVDLLVFPTMWNIYRLYLHVRSLTHTNVHKPNSRY